MKQEQQSKRPLEGYGMGMDGANKRVKSGNETLEVGLLVRSNDMGQVIGKGGETIKSIRNKSGASISTSKFLPNVGERTAQVIGTIVQVRAAIRMIIDTLGKEPPSITFLAEHRNLGALIGKQGVNIKKLREETGANIFIPKECIGNSTQKEIQISGDYEAVTQAVETVVCYLAEGRNTTRIPYVPGEVAGFPMGQMGQMMPSFPSTGGGGRFNQLQGPLGGQSISPSTIPQGMGFNAQSTPGASVCRIETTIYVPREVIGQIIGRGGSNIKAVRMQSTANIYVDAGEDGDESPERKITIKGSRTAIDLACGMIEDLANNRR